jgi:hypothetical protein
LRDGRVLFNAAVMQRPFATADAGGQREQLFAVDRTRQSTLSRMIPRKSEEALPPGLSYFTVSPGEDKVLFGTLKGDVHVLTLAPGQVDQVQTATEDEMQGAPLLACRRYLYVRPPSANSAPPSGDGPATGGSGDGAERQLVQSDAGRPYTVVEGVLPANGQPGPACARTVHPLAGSALAMRCRRRS